MNTTILITPRAFGNIAAAAMSHGCDVTTFLVRSALAGSNNLSRLRAKRKSTPPAPTIEPEGETDTPSSDVETVAPARGTSGLLALASDDVASFTPQH